MPGLASVFWNAFSPRRNWPSWGYRRRLTGWPLVLRAKKRFIRLWAQRPGIRWQEIEILSVLGQPEVRLSGQTEQWAQARGSPSAS